jgi:hypothetical protein
MRGSKGKQSAASTNFSGDLSHLGTLNILYIHTGLFMSVYLL